MNKTIEIQKKDLPLCCPLPNQAVWDKHPRVYLPIEENGGKIMCPYCSAEYRLKANTQSVSDGART